MFAQNHTQNTRAHQRIFVPGIPFASKKLIIGTMAIVIGILSIIAVRTAAPQRMTIAVATMFFSTHHSMSVAI